MAVDVESQGQVQEFLDVLKKRRWQVILPALVITALGTVFAVIVPKKYVVDCRVELLEPAGQLRGQNELATQREIENAQLHITNYNRVLETIQGQNWNDFNRLDDEGQHDYVRAVRRNLRVRVHEKKKDSRGSTFVDIVYADTDGDRAEKFLTALIQHWVDDVVARDYRELELERNEFQNQVDAARANYDEVMERFTSLVQEMGVSITQPKDLKAEKEEDPVFEELTFARLKRDEVQADLEELRAKISSLREDHDALDPEIAQVESDPGLDFAKQITEKQGQILALRRTQQGKTQENSLYRKAQAQIESLEEEIELLQASQREATKRTVYVDNPARKTLAAQIRELEIQAAGLQAKHDDWVAKVEETDARYQAQVENWNELLSVYKTWEHSNDELDEAAARLRGAEAKYKALLAAQADPYRIAEQPRAGAEPEEPNPWLIVAFSLLGGLAFGLAVAFVSEFSRSCYRNVGELTRVMGVPVLGVINEIRTVSEMRRERFRRAVVGGSTLVIVAGLGWFTWAWSFRPDQLPTPVVQVVDDLRLQLR